MGRRARVILIALAAAAALGPAAGPARADDAAALDHDRRDVDRAAASLGSSTVAERLAAELNAAWGRTPAPYSAESLTAQRAATGWGWGEVVIGNRLAQQIAESLMAANPSLTPAQALAQALAQVTAARQARTGWGVIAQQNGLKLGPLVSDVRRAATTLGAGAKGSAASAKGTEKGAKGADKTAKGSDPSAKGKGTESATEDRGFSAFDTAGNRSPGVAVAGGGGAGRGGPDHGAAADKGGGHGAGEGHGGGAGGGDRGGGGGGGGGGGPRGGGGKGGGGGRRWRRRARPVGVRPRVRAPARELQPRPARVPRRGEAWAGVRAGSFGSPVTVPPG